MKNRVLLALAILLLLVGGYRMYHVWDSGMRRPAVGAMRGAAHDPHEDAPANIPAPLRLGRMLELPDEMEIHEMRMSPDGTRVAIVHSERAPAAERKTRLTIFQGTGGEVVAEFPQLENLGSFRWISDAELVAIAGNIRSPDIDELAAAKSSLYRIDPRLRDVALVSSEIDTFVQIAGGDSREVHLVDASRGSTVTFKTVSLEDGSVRDRFEWMSWGEGPMDLRTYGETAFLRPELSQIAPVGTMIVLLLTVIDPWENTNPLIGFDVETNEFHELDYCGDQLPADEKVWTFAWGLNGELWLGTQDSWPEPTRYGLYKCDGSRLTHVATSEARFTVRGATHDGVLLGGYQDIAGGRTLTHREWRGLSGRIGRPFWLTVDE